MAQELTQERLKEVLHYDPETGVFTWKVRTSKRVRIGDRAGYFGTYVFIRLLGELYRAHRLAWLYAYGTWPTKDIDHWDRNKHNNSLANLREVTVSENLFNIGVRSDSTSGVSGVSWSKRDQVWRAYIAGKSGRQINLGSYKSKSAAIKARRVTEVEMGISIFNEGDIYAFDSKSPCIGKSSDNSSENSALSN